MNRGSLQEVLTPVLTSGFSAQEGPGRHRRSIRDWPQQEVEGFKGEKSEGWVQRHLGEARGRGPGWRAWVPVPEKVRSQVLQVERPLGRITPAAGGSHRPVGSPGWHTLTLQQRSFLRKIQFPQIPDEVLPD